MKMQLDREEFPDPKVFHPDCSFAMLGGLAQPIVVEIAVTQTREDLLRKAKNYYHGGGVGVKALVLINIEGSYNAWQTTIWVWKLNRVPAPLPEKPNGFRMQKTPVVDEVEIFPADKTHGEELVLDKADLFPGQHKNVALPHPDQTCIRIPISAFHHMMVEAFEQVIHLAELAEATDPGVVRSHSNSSASERSGMEEHDAEDLDMSASEEIEKDGTDKGDIEMMWRWDSMMLLQCTTY